jgi:hypothetical protein
MGMDNRDVRIALRKPRDIKDAPFIAKFRVGSFSAKVICKAGIVNAD